MRVIVGGRLQVVLGTCSGSECFAMTVACSDLDVTGAAGPFGPMLARARN
jgi:hypothetical protein